MTAEDTIKQILREHPEVTRDQILEKLQAEKNKTGGLIADTTLLRLVAAKFGVKIPQEKVQDHKLSISHLVPGLNDVSITGRIVAVYQPRVFEGKKSGKFASLFITDKDSIIRVILWNDKADSIEKGELKVGRIVRFSHGYTREDRDAKTELHMGGKSEVDIEPPNINRDDFPLMGKFVTKIKEITKAKRNIQLVGTVKKLFPSSNFVRSDATTGTVLHFILADDTGEVSVVAWNEKAEELEKKLKTNACLQLVNARVKNAQNGGFEVHVDSNTFVSTLVTN
jgi:ssDNA-binding replication factor A large subunit